MSPCQDLQSRDVSIQTVYDKVQITGYTEGLDDLIRLQQKTSKRAHTVLGKQIIWTDETKMNEKRNIENEGNCFFPQIMIRLSAY